MTEPTLADLIEGHSGKVVDKWSSYVELYDRLFAPIRHDRIRILEIGIQNGGSLELWTRYFPDAQSIVGCDIEPACGALIYDDPRISVVIGDAGDPAVAAAIAAHGPFDIVIDDGSHRPRDVVRTFAGHFGSLRPGGLYIVEDLHCSYWEDHEGGLHHPHSAVAFLKALADVLHAGHLGLDLSRADLLAPFARAHGIDWTGVPLDAVGGVAFHDSLCVVTRHPASGGGLGRRLVRGGEAEVRPVPTQAQMEHHPDERGNAWSVPGGPARRSEAEIELAALRASRTVRYGARVVAALEKAWHARLAAGIGGRVALLRDGDGVRLEWTGAHPVPAGHYRLDVAVADASDLGACAIDADPGSGVWEPVVERPRWSVAGGRATTRFTLLFKTRGLRLREAGELPDGAAMRLRLVGRAERYSRLAWQRARPLLTDAQARGWAARRTLEILRSRGVRGLAEALRKSEAPQANSYEDWIARNEDLGPEALAALRERVDRLARRPLISVLMPVYNTPPNLLREAIDSVRAQVYGNWQLCIADDASTDPAIRPFLEAAAAADPRIRVVFRPANGHISHASNSALELVTGEWIALLDHDDILRPHALAEVALEIDRHPEAGLIYSDEDKIDEAGRRYEPYFKPDFSRELFHSQNYLNHLTVHRTEHVRALGGWRPGFEGSQDYDLNLRVFERVGAQAIRHIPKVLYHWRAVTGSAAMHAGSKSYAFDAGLRALRDHLRRTGAEAEASPAPGLPFYRVRHVLPDPAPRASIIIPTRDQAAILRTCIESIAAKTSYPDYEVIVVDNGSREPDALAFLAQIERRPGMRVIRDDRPFNYSALNNRAAAEASGEVLVLLNNDTEVIAPDWLGEMVSWAIRPDVGCVGAKLYYPDGTIQHAGVVMGLGGVAGHADVGRTRADAGYFGRLRVVHNLSAVTGACLALRRAVYDRVGGLDEKLAVAFNDIDLCLKARAAGYVNVWTPHAELYHHESLSRGQETTPAQHARFMGEAALMKVRWPEMIARDPCYSPSLSLVRNDFSLS